MQKEMSRSEGQKQGSLKNDMVMHRCKGSVDIITVAITFSITFSFYFFSPE